MKEYIGGSKEGWNVYSPVIKTIKLDPEEKILDAGCGEGMMMEYFNGKEVYGIDLNPENVRRARRKNYKEVKVGDLRKIPYSSNSFDTVVCIEVLQFIEYPEEVFKELLRVAKKRVIVSFPNHNASFLLAILRPNGDLLFRNFQEKKAFMVNQDLLERWGEKCGIKPRVDYLSMRFGFIRNLKKIGKWWAGEIVGEYKKHQK